MNSPIWGYHGLGMSYRGQPNINVHSFGHSKSRLEILTEPCIESISRLKNRTMHGRCGSDRAEHHIYKRTQNIAWVANVDLICNQQKIKGWRATG